MMFLLLIQIILCYTQIFSKDIAFKYRKFDVLQLSLPTLVEKLHVYAPQGVDNLL